MMLPTKSSPFVNFPAACSSRTSIGKSTSGDLEELKADASKFALEILEAQTKLALKKSEIIELQLEMGKKQSEKERNEAKKTFGTIDGQFQLVGKFQYETSKDINYLDETVEWLKRRVYHLSEDDGDDEPLHPDNISPSKKKRRLSTNGLGYQYPKRPIQCFRPRGLTSEGANSGHVAAEDTVNTSTCSSTSNTSGVEFVQMRSSGVDGDADVAIDE